MRKLSIIATTSLLAGLLVVGCGDEDDNPGKPNTNEGGETSSGGEDNNGTAGTKTNTAGKPNGGSGGTPSQGGEGNQPMAGNGGDGIGGDGPDPEPVCEDV